MYESAYQRACDLEFDCCCEYKTCKFCGEGGFHWEMTHHGWRLFDDCGNKHNCLSRCGPSSATAAICKLQHEVRDLRGQLRDVKAELRRRR